MEPTPAEAQQAETTQDKPATLETRKPWQTPQLTKIQIEQTESFKGSGLDGFGASGSP